jgi:hypothetical protein
MGHSDKLATAGRRNSQVQELPIVKFPNPRFGHPFCEYQHSNVTAWAAQQGHHDCRRLGATLLNAVMEENLSGSV